MTMTQNGPEDKGQVLAGELEQLRSYVLQAAEEGMAAHEVELNVWQKVLRLGYEAMSLFFEAQGNGDVGESVEWSGGRTLRRLPDMHVRRYQSVFGEHWLQRVAYGTREGQKIEWVPLDQRLGLPENEFSYVLQDWCQALSTEHAFSRTAQTLQRILRLRMHVDTLEQMNRKMAEPVESFRQTRPKPDKKQEGKILVATADNKGIPMRRPSDQMPAGARRKKGEKANKKQMATVGCVYTVDAKMRGAEDVVAALFRERSEKPPDNPEPVARNKRVWSSLSREQNDAFRRGEDAVFEWMAEEVANRRRRNQPLVVLMDGQPSLWADRQTHLPGTRVVEILDLLHVTPRLWEAAYLFHGEGSDEAAEFVRDRLLRILQGKASRVVGGLRQMGTKHGLRGTKLKKLTTICNYLQKNLSRMHYNEYLAQGYPIASGVIEGACRYVVKDRMERAGMRWTVEGAQAMLDLRSTYVNDQWEEFQGYRIAQNAQRLYPHQELLANIKWPLAA